LFFFEKNDSSVFIDAVLEQQKTFKRYQEIEKLEQSWQKTDDNISLKEGQTCSIKMPFLNDENNNNETPNNTFLNDENNNNETPPTNNNIDTRPPLVKEQLTSNESEDIFSLLAPPPSTKKGKNIVRSTNETKTNEKNWDDLFVVNNTPETKEDEFESFTSTDNKGDIFGEFGSFTSSTDFKDEEFGNFTFDKKDDIVFGSITNTENKINQTTGSGNWDSSLFK